MISDFKMIIHNFPTELGYMNIIPISDVHLGASECMEKEFRELIKFVAEDEHTFLTLGGDLCNNSTKSSIANVYDEVYRPMEQKRLMADILKPVKCKILAAVGGNHEARTLREVDSDITLDIMSKLDIEHLYRPNMAFTTIRFGGAERNKMAGKDRPSYNIGLIHGAGGGAFTGSAVNRNERFGNVIDGLDCLIVGHSHKPAMTVPTKLKIDPRNGNVICQPYLQVISTSWLSYGGYALQKQLTPASNCMQILHLNGTKKEMSMTLK